jgi:beta-lactamase regulating signal transducer with metallopeptidase domain/thiol-disulfide isomerase/thioredoxin
MTLPNGTADLIQLLWRASWQAVVLAAIVLVITSSMRRWIAPKWRTILWTIPLVRMVLLFVPASPLSVFNFFPQAAVTDSATSSAPVAAWTSGALGSSEIVAVSNAQSAITARDPMSAARSSMTSKPAPALDVPASGLLTLPGVLAMAWAVGCGVLLIRWIGARLVLERLVARAEPLDVEHLIRLIETTRNRHAIWRPVRCLVTNERIAPSSCGFWRPTILLPRTAIKDFSDLHLRTIVKHEFEHIRRCDALLLVLQRFALVLHWFNPLVYFMGSRLRREMELAVDAAAVGDMDERARHSYGRLLIELSQRSARPLAVAQMVDQRSNLKARIDQLSAPPKNGLARTAACVCMILTLIVAGLSDAAQTQEQGASQANKQAALTADDPPTDETRAARGKEDNPSDVSKEFAVVGTVREAGTDKPVAGAEIQILVASEQDPDKRVLKGVTNEDGEYRIEVPMGNVQIWFPALAPGYWLTPEQGMQRLTTSPENPIVKHDIVAQRGAVWDVQVEGDTTGMPYRIMSVIEVADDAKRAAWLNRENVSLAESPAQAYTYFSETGRGSLTEIGTSGELLIGVANVMTEFIIEPGFDNARIVTVERQPDSDTTRMTDAAGKTATIGKATVTVRDGTALLTFRADMPAKAGSQELKGQVADVEGKPLAGVRVGVAIGSKGGGSAAQLEEAISAVDGRFSLKVPIHSHQNVGAAQFSVILTKDGYAAMDSRRVDGEADFTPIDFGRLAMRPGCSIPVRVLDESGNPVPGAEVEPIGDYAQRRQAVRTSADGRAVIRNVPSGVVSVQTRWGEKVASTKLVVSENDEDNTEVTVRLSQPQTASTGNSEPLNPIAVGELAPEWDIALWSDGKSRKLSDYRGRVVVLDFWGVWCGPCVSSIPAKLKLAEDFANREVVFLGIHTADGDMAQINKLKNIHRWTTPTGIDRGSSMVDGTTCRSYGVARYPTTIIIDADGRVAFNSDVPPKDRETYMKQIEELAKESGIQWPPPADADQEEMERFANQIQHALLSREIKRVLRDI